MWRNTPKVYHSLQLHISHQLRSYSSTNIIWWLSYTCFLGTWTLGQFGGKSPNTPKSSTGSHKKKLKVFSSLFHIRWDLTLVFRSSDLFHRYLGIGAISENWNRIPQIMCKDTWKIIQSLQLLVWHQMGPCCSFRAICGLSYTCFTGIWVLGQFGETGLKYPKSHAEAHEK